MSLSSRDAVEGEAHEPYHKISFFSSQKQTRLNSPCRRVEAVSHPEDEYGSSSNNRMVRSNRREGEPEPSFTPSRGHEPYTSPPRHLSERLRMYRNGCPVLLNFEVGKLYHLNPEKSFVQGPPREQLSHVSPQGYPPKVRISSRCSEWICLFFTHHRLQKYPEETWSHRAWFETRESRIVALLCRKIFCTVEIESFRESFLIKLDVKLNRIDRLAGNRPGLVTRYGCRGQTHCA